MGIAVRRIASKTALAALTRYAADDVYIVVGTRDIFLFDATSEDAHDGTDVIKPDDLLARKPGRWIRAKFKAEDLDGTDGLPTHASAHENGGGDEISVEGLSGVLADPQLADTIHETSGPTDLEVGDVPDGHLLQRDGSAIIGLDPATLGGGFFSLTPPPAAAGWTAINSANPADFSKGIYLYSAANGDVNTAAIKGIQRAIPASAFRVTIAIMPVLILEKWVGCGIYVADNDGKIVAQTIAVKNDNYPMGIGVTKYDSPILWSADYVTGGNLSMTGGMIFMRIEVSGGNRVYSISADGENFFTILSTADNDHLTATKWGFFVNAQHATKPVACSLVHCVEEDLS